MRATIDKRSLPFPLQTSHFGPMQAPHSTSAPDDLSSRTRPKPYIFHGLALPCLAPSLAKHVCPVTTMALRGQRFELDLDADDFTPTPITEKSPISHDSPNLIGEIKERDPAAAPAPPKLKASRTGFPEHTKRTHFSAFRKQKARQHDSPPLLSPQHADSSQTLPIRSQPSDQAIAHQLGRKHGYDFETQEKAKISEENNRRIAAMSDEEIDDARAELMANLNPALIERLLKRANIDDDNPIKSRLPEDQVRDDGHGEPASTEAQDEHGMQNQTPRRREKQRANRVLIPSKAFQLRIQYTSQSRHARHHLLSHSIRTLQPSWLTSRPTTFPTPLTTLPRSPGFETLQRKKMKSHLTTPQETITPPPSFAFPSQAPSSHPLKASKSL